MAKITMELIKKLRDKTQVGMMDCKNALIESEGNLEKAIELLRKKGSAVAKKRAGNITNNGHIESCISSNFQTGVLLKISCETDFSANTQDMKDFSREVCKHILNKETKDVNELLGQKLFENESITVQQRLEELISKIAESIKTEEFIKFETDSKGLINSYIHPGANLGTMVELHTDKELDQGDKEQLKLLSHEICMQVAVTDPLAISPDGLDETTLEKEKEVIKGQLMSSGKPENVIEKITQGKLQKFYEETCLEKQKFIKNDKKTIAEIIKEASDKTGMNIKIKRFARFQVGS